jgi:hypothetical protein
LLEWDDRDVATLIEHYEAEDKARAQQQSAQNIAAARAAYQAQTK